MCVESNVSKKIESFSEVPGKPASKWFYNVHMHLLFFYVV